MAKSVIACWYRGVLFHVYKEDDGYIAVANGVPVFTQGDTLEELIDNAKEAIDLWLEEEGYD